MESETHTCIYIYLLSQENGAPLTDAVTICEEVCDSRRNAVNVEVSLRQEL